MSVEIESIEHELEESIASLRQAGVRITPQRQAILRYLISSHTHPTADEIYQALSPDFPNISVATIYNNLRVFKDIGIVKELTYGDSSSRFDFNTHNHYHIICEQCGKIVDFQYPQLNEIERLAQYMTDFDVTHHRMEIYGVCKECQDK
ncbi:TPA: peroxide-responsive transcriptional repressor PerR [Staphylococcus aureus]|uniref:peroxide-responsive transcriptional repressor PerR n=1 Tax=Staphylococcus aureus TaxID=1280 RepID=UPI0004960992|nr:peroxide-responsive transcriptional repressor PerR [Staphylococcus aureus]HBC4557756.1 peroxide-responsive transcriptional repressor PerR [Staphylococcus aureus]HBC4563374.1 peroxide-responsive transcriptional repressor PerR [Staphylococcus aureus]HDC5778884.1 peroxide-responsive transcriptional repressor PerR [Staphylococcus aureus]HDD3372616.1 peroxide-responsive transcriptional repressor PerR [Staphylococcus aureus]HDD4539106.1 peroxide-responsive transcriptional repressor PerR [Staphylo